MLSGMRTLYRDVVVDWWWQGGDLGGRIEIRDSQSSKCTFTLMLAISAITDRAAHQSEFRLVPSFDDAATPARRGRKIRATTEKILAPLPPDKTLLRESAIRDGARKGRQGKETGREEKMRTARYVVVVLAAGAELEVPYTELVKYILPKNEKWLAWPEESRGWKQNNNNAYLGTSSAMERLTGAVVGGIVALEDGVTNVKMIVVE
ncbi:hypothetical protein BDZ89DRAFT_1037061 [Hymenopellis radicata]|nr:hypothetical protein BDZ89DRAFT_1037061 [Hymenopellis radicata]